LQPDHLPIREDRRELSYSEVSDKEILLKNPSKVRSGSAKYITGKYLEPHHPEGVTY